MTTCVGTAELGTKHNEAYSYSEDETIETQGLASPRKQRRLRCSKARNRYPLLLLSHTRDGDAGVGGSLSLSGYLAGAGARGMESSSGGGKARRRSSGGSWGSVGDAFDIPAKGAPVDRLKKWRVSSSPPFPSWPRPPTIIR
jgi:hypothetical protein